MSPLDVETQPNVMSRFVKRVAEGNALHYPLLQREVKIEQAFSQKTFAPWQLCVKVLGPYHLNNLGLFALFTTKT